MQQTPDTVYWFEHAYTGGFLEAEDIASGQRRWGQKNLTYPAPFQPHFTYGALDSQVLGVEGGLVYVDQEGSFPPEGRKGVQPAEALAAFRVADGQQVWQRIAVSPTRGNVIIPAGQPNLSSNVMAPLLYDGTLYVSSLAVVTTVLPPPRYPLSVLPPERAQFNTTTFTLSTLALEGQTGQPLWQKQHVATFRVRLRRLVRTVLPSEKVWRELLPVDWEQLLPHSGCSPATPGK